MSAGSSVIAIVKKYFISGVLVVVPVILTYIVLRFLFEAIDGILQPVLHRLFGYYVPGLGIFTTVLLIILAGVLTRNFIGARLYKMGDRILVRLPIIRLIYSAAKQLLTAVTGPTTSSFKEVALVEYPRKGTYALSFVSNRIMLQSDGDQREHFVVFVPSTPTPISGMVVLVPAEEVIPLDMTVEEGIRFLVSGGVASPDLLKRKAQGALSSSEGVFNETR
jgi:uncharacterized membrane protein